MTGDTPVMLADGTVRPIAELVGSRPWLWSVDEHYRPTRARASKVWCKGERAVLRVTTKTGRTIRVTSEHPFLTADAGWKPLSTLQRGSRIAAPIGIPLHGSPTMSEDEALLLGLLTGDGALTTRPHTYTDGNASIRAIVAELARRLGVVAKPKRGEIETLVLSTPPGQPNPINDLVAQSGLYGLKSPARMIPPAVLRGTDRIAAAYLRGLWSTDGCATDREVKFATASRALADQCQWLCARLGIHTMLATQRFSRGGYPGSQGREYWTVTARRAKDIRAFADRVGLLGTKHLRLLETLLLHGATSDRRDHMIDLVPREMWSHIHDARRAAGLEWLAVFGRSGVDERRAIRRDRFQRIVAKIPGAPSSLKAVAEAPVVFDEIVSIEPAGRELVYDAEVPGLANFLAAGLWVHNSGVVEEAVDYLIALRRLDRSTRLGEADRDRYRDVIFARVVKNRHGSVSPREVAIRVNPNSLALVEDAAVQIDEHTNARTRKAEVRL